MFCPNCGKEVDTKFCPNCGEKVEEKLSIISDDDLNKDFEVQPLKKTFGKRLMEQVNEINQAKLNDKQELKKRIKQYDKDGIPYCPKCYSTSLSANKKGFGIGKAIIGYTVAPIGLVAGNIGAKKVRITCLKCGYQFMAGKK